MKTNEIRKLKRVRSTGTIDDKKAKVKGIANPKEKTSLQREIKRTIAKVKTIIREREMAQN